MLSLRDATTRPSKYLRTIELQIHNDAAQIR